MVTFIIKMVKRVGVIRVVIIIILFHFLFAIKTGIIEVDQMDLQGQPSECLKDKKLNMFS